MTVTDPNAGPAMVSTVPASNHGAGGSGTLHGTGGATAAAPAAVRPSRTGTTAHGAQVFVDPGDDSVSVPMTGPSRKTLVAGAMGIAVVSLAIGAVGAWRAVKDSRPQTTLAPPLPEQDNAVALLEMPRSLPRVGDPAAQRAGHSRANGGRATGPATAGNGASAGNGAVENNGAGSSGTGAGSAGSAGTGGTHASAGSARATRPSGNGSGATGSTGSAGSSGSSASNGSGNGAGSGSAAGSSGSGGAIEGSGLSGPRAPAQNGYVEGEATDATGTLDPAAFTFVYRHFRTQISSCHSSVTRGGQTVAGILRVRVRIGTDGHVVRTSVAENTTNSAVLATCVQNQIRTWRYPSPEGGEVEMEYRFGFGN